MREAIRDGAAGFVLFALTVLAVDHIPLDSRRHSADGWIVLVDVLVEPQQRGTGLPRQPEPGTSRDEVFESIQSQAASRPPGSALSERKAGE